MTTRVPCVGNGVPWVRAGVGAVATQANTRTEYGNELLDATFVSMGNPHAVIYTPSVQAIELEKVGRQA